MRLGFWILDGHTPVPCDLMTLGKFLEHADRHVRWTEQEGVNVSTVFLGLDHRFGGDGPPLLFETMVFGGEHDRQMVRYSSWDDAEAGHAAMVKRVFAAAKAGR